MLLPAGSAAAESQTFVTRFPFTTALANPCVTPEDLVLINGELLVETHLTFNDNHILSEITQSSHDIDARSVLTGDSYSYVEEQGSVLSGQALDGTYVSEAHSTLHLVHHGDTPQPTDDDLHVHAVVVARYDPRTGEVTVQQDRFDAECR